MSQHGGLLGSPVEVEETYFGGKGQYKSASKQIEAGRGAVGNTAVFGAKELSTNKVAAKVESSTDKDTLQCFAKAHAAPTAEVCTDDGRAYDALPYEHAFIRHSLKESFKGDVQTNGIASLRSMLMGAHEGTVQKPGPQQLDR